MRQKNRLLQTTPSALLVVIMAISAIVLSLNITPSSVAIAQDSLRTLTVTGRGSERIDTTLAQVELGVEVSGDSATEVQTEVARRATAVVELLRSQNVQNLETTGIRLNPQYRYDDGRSELVGYIGSNTVSFRQPTDQVGELLDQAVAAGATQIQDIRFIAEDAAIADARDVALAAATQDAQRQANAVLSSLDLGPQEIVSIQIDGARPPIPIPLPASARLEAAQADFSTPVVGGEHNVEAAVTLQIRY